MAEPSVKKNFILSTGYQALTFWIPLIITPYASRVLGPEGIGIASFTNSIVAYFTMIAVLGSDSYGVREIARVRDDLARRSQLFWEIEGLSVITSLVSLAAWGFWIAVTDSYQFYYAILTLSILGSLVDISWFFIGLEKFSYIVYRNAAFRLVGLVEVFLLVRDSSDTAWYIGIFAAATLLGNLSMWLYLPRFVGRPDFRNFRLLPHLRETLIYFVPTIATSLYTVLDKTLIGIIVQLEAENGYYEQATKICNMGKTLTFGALNSVMGARMSYLFAENRIQEIHERITTSLEYILIMGFAVMFGLIGMAEHFVPWFFGAGFEQVVILLQVLSPVVLIIGISNCLGAQYYSPAGLRALSARFVVAGAVVNVILNLILIPHLWSLGAIIGSLAAEGTITVLYLYYCGDYMTVRLIAERGWRKLVAGLAMLAALLALNALLSITTLAILAEMVAGAAIYMLVLWLLGDRFLGIFLGKVRSLLPGWRR